jgi:hypothetical protein
MRYICFLSLIALALPAIAQEYRGSILGRITDPSAAPVSGATVEVANPATGFVTSTNSNELGNYQALFLVPGEYVVGVAHPGFKKVERKGIRVLTGSAVTLDLSLEIGAATETVTVTAAAPLLTTSGSDLGQVIGSAYLENITVSLSRNVLYNVRLAPGITGGGGSVTGNGAGNYTVSGGGSTVGRIEYSIDGIPNTVAQNDGGVVYIPSTDAVEEIKVHTTMFDAQYGHSNGGAINITTKGGGNELHGTAYLFKRWAALDANTWTNNSRGIPKGPVSYRQFGYLVSGPVFIPKLYDGRNKTFFSTTLESDRDARDLTREARVPTDLERQGDFSQTLNRRGGAFAIYDPATTVVTAGRATRQPFAGARIPAARISPGGQAWLNLLPKPTRQVPAQLELYNWDGTGIYSVVQEQWSVRLDHYVSQRQRLFGRYGLLTRDQNADTLIPGQHTMPVQGGSDLEHLIRRFENFGFDDTFTFSPTFLASLRFGYVRKVNTSDRGAVGFDTSGLKLPPILESNQAVPGWPVYNLGENTPTLGSERSFVANDLYATMATFTKLTGPHSLKWGADWRVLRWNRNSPGSAASGNFTFNNTFTRSDPFTPTSGDTSGSGMASLLLGLPAFGSLGYTSSLSLQNHYVGMFIQDDWKVNSRLTLNFGLRFELETPYTERYNRMSYGFDENAKLPVTVPGFDLRGGIVFAATGGYPRRGGIIDGNNFGPRFGFAYSPAAKTVLRGGYGMFFSGQAFNTGFLADVGVFNSNTPSVGTIDNGATPYATLANPFPEGLREPVGASAGLMAQAGDSLSFFDERRVSPYNQQWQFSVQREFPSQILVEAAYVGMLSLKQFESFNLNEKPDQYLALGTAENNRVTNPFLGAFPPTSVLGQGSTVTANRLWVRFPQFTSLTIQGANTGRATYNALQLKIDKRLTHGLNFLWTYTWSKLFDNETTSVINPRRYRTVSGQDRTHVMRLGAVYAFPWRLSGQGWDRFWNQLVSGWSVNGYWIYESGTPMSISHANGRPIRVRNPALSGPVGERLGDKRDPKTNLPLNPYFDINAFAPLANQYVVPPEPPRFAELRTPSTRALNLSLFKTFPIYERIRLQFRAEATGITNSPNFSAPGTNLSSPTTFGIITGAGGSRAMQGSLRVIF